MLDIILPKIYGNNVLQHIKTSERLKHTPVIMLKTSSDEADIRKSYENPVNCYIPNPLDDGSFKKVVSTIEDYWISIVQPPKSQTK